MTRSPQESAFHRKDLRVQAATCLQDLAGLDARSRRRARQALRLAMCLTLCLVVLLTPLLATRAMAADLHLPPRQAGEAHAQAQRPESQPPASDAATRWLQTRAALPPRWPVVLADLQTVYQGGTSAQSLDVVLVGDGFTADQRDAFFAAATTTANALLAFSPYAEYASLFNVYALFVASDEAGASHPAAGSYVDNAFGTTFDYGGIDRLAVADDAKVIEAVSSAFPAFDIAVVVVNDPAYGGSGGAVPVVSMAPDAIAILRHELGHNLAHLADEYDAPYPGYPAGDGEPNVASAAHLAPLKWQDWVKPGTAIPTLEADVTSLYTPVGAYEGARYLSQGMFRPAPNCLMRSLDMVFCPVCAEALIVAVHKSTAMLRSRLPAPTPWTTCTLGACPTFAVQTAPIPTLEIHWLRDGIDVAQGPNWTPGADELGDHAIVVQVVDRTPHVRSDPGGALVEEAAWNLHVDATPPPPDDGVRSLDAGAGDASPESALAGTPAVAAAGCQAGAGAGSPWALAAALWWIRRRRTRA